MGFCSIHLLTAKQYCLEREGMQKERTMEKRKAGNEKGIKKN
jgi:hypothetical protein